jgi:hypothetical protein
MLSLETSGGLWWPPVASGGLRWPPVASGGLWWPLVASGGLFRNLTWIKGVFSLGGLVNLKTLTDYVPCKSTFVAMYPQNKIYPSCSEIVI